MTVYRRSAKSLLVLSARSLRLISDLFGALDQFLYFFSTPFFVIAVFFMVEAVPQEGQSSRLVPISRNSSCHYRTSYS